MATIYSDQYQDAYVDVPSNKIGRGEFNAKVHIIYFSHTVTAAPSNGDVLKLCKLPKGARVLNAVLSHGDLGTAGTLNLGWAASDDAVESADADGLIASIDVATAAAIVTMHEQTGAAVPGLLKQFAAEVDVQLDIATAWTATSGSIKGYIEYVVS